MRRLIYAILVTCHLLSAPAAFAQEGTPAAAPSPQGSPSAVVGDAQLGAPKPFVDADSPFAATQLSEGETGPARAYAVDYVIAFRNVLALVTLALVFAHVQSGARGRKKSSGKGYGALIACAVVGLLAMQGLSSLLYARESAAPGGTLHKTVPFGREYFLY